MVDCHCRPATAAHLELYLDWSLIRPGASQQQADAADFVASHPIAKAARAQAIPGPAAASKPRMADARVPSLASVAAQQAAASRPGSTGDATPEVCPALVLELLGIAHKDVQVQPGSAEQQAQAASAQHKRQASSSEPQPPAKRRLPSDFRSSAGQPDAATTATEAAPHMPSGVQAGKATAPMDPPAAINAAAEMAFFLQLNGGAPPGQQQAAPAASMDSDDGMSSDEPQEVQVGLCCIVNALACQLSYQASSGWLAAFTATCSLRCCRRVLLTRMSVNAGVAAGDAPAPAPAAAAST